MDFRTTNSPEGRRVLAEQLARLFHERADEVDKQGKFPFENFNILMETGYTTLTVPKEYGGMDISLLELIQLQEILAEGDGSTALAVGWHMGIIKNLSEKRPWKEEVFRKVCEHTLKHGSLINSAASEKSTGSPTRGGKPQTVAVKTGEVWRLTGRKIFTTLSPVLDFVLVSASLEGRDEAGTFLVPMNTPGVSIEETWDSISMRGTGSHDLVLQDVEVNDEQLVETASGNKAPNGWLLHIPACYLGIASAAQTYAISFAKSYSPNSINGTISEIPTVRQRIGEMELLLMQSRHFLYSVARKWDESNEETRSGMLPELNAAKMSVVNTAQKIVDLAMRVVGASSLSQSNPLQRYYRDVRAGLHNPPMDDMTIQVLAASALNSKGS
ncbi:acyl-CoA dehydrogenase [Bacillus sp. FJAT-18017]|uniref:acyl-CoA dehydrogenase family protein n=1 Tax=Bacillus sp. FJAT-18017 TaxID=1705566 RepID=UPI0006AE8178|nr:acyl-CoA dehydrogenase family protein [Bacillus sp. FJAT-18017]ALC90412.1 acyl-CoA dehydrogenase [Bacillus sp. FJAT-18017]